MNDHYERKWEVVEELEIELFDRNLVRIEWLARDGLANEEFPDQIRIHTTAYQAVRRMRRFRKLQGDRDYGAGWEPIIIAALDEATSDLRSVPFDTFDEFILRVFLCFRELWADACELPGSRVGMPTDLDGFYQAEAIQAALEMMTGPLEFSEDPDGLENWGIHEEGPSDPEEDE